MNAPFPMPRYFGDDWPILEPGVIHPVVVDVLGATAVAICGEPWTIVTAVAPQTKYLVQHPALASRTFDLSLTLFPCGSRIAMLHCAYCSGLDLLDAWVRRARAGTLSRVDREIGPPNPARYAAVLAGSLDDPRYYARCGDILYRRRWMLEMLPERQP